MGDKAMPEEMKTLADQLGRYIMRNYVEERLARTVSYYRATVTATASGGKITVQRPFDTPIALPYVSSAASLGVGDQCVVLVLGGMGNSVIIGDGMLQNL